MDAVAIDRANRPSGWIAAAASSLAGSLFARGGRSKNLVPTELTKMLLAVSSKLPFEKNRRGHVPTQRM